MVFMVELLLDLQSIYLNIIITLVLSNGYTGLAVYARFGGNPTVLVGENLPGA